MGTPASTREAPDRTLPPATGPNCERLRALKERFGPENRFRASQHVGFGDESE